MNITKTNKIMEAKIWNHREWITETDPITLYKHFNDLLQECQFEVLRVMEHHFEPEGYTALWLLGESHFAIHTFPEHGKSYIEMASCNAEKHQKFIDNI